jgi:threonine dehydrogenase-like Zn-dependent dehydrogenase
VIAPHTWSDGTCDYCRAGLHSSCVDGGMWGTPGHDGAHGEAVRVPNADGTLVVIPPELRAEPERVLPVAEVMAAGQHAARAAGIGYGTTVAVVGDGAVGLCGVLAASRSGAEQIIAIGRHADRLDVAKRFGATDLVVGRGDEVVEEVLSLTGGVDAVLECVGSQNALDTAIAVAKDGAQIGYVGAPHLVEGLDLSAIFCRNISLRGGVCPSRAYLPQLLSAVASGTLDPSPVFDRRVSLDKIATGYQAMDRRDSIKVLVDIY